MGKPSSSVTTAVSVRIPNDLLRAVTEHALSHGFINEAGRMDKRGQPNLSAAMADLLKSALELSDRQPSLEPTAPSHAMIAAEDPLEAKVTAIAHTLSNSLYDAIVQRLDALSDERAVATVQPVEVVKTSSLNRSPQPSSDEGLQHTSKHKKEMRGRILNAASRSFRMRGYSGIGVDGLAKAAGVTSGAFYGHFRSKEEAFLAAVVAGLDEYRAGVETFRANYGEDWTIALADYYLGQGHRHDLACGCALPTLSPEVVRSSDSRVRSAYQTGLLRLTETVAAGLATGTATEKRDDAWVLLSLLAGGVTLARAVWDEALAEQISAAVRRAAIAIRGLKSPTDTDAAPITVQPWVCRLNRTMPQGSATNPLGSPSK